MRFVTRALTIIFLLFSADSFATHIVGGEMYYDYIGNNTYRITLKLYRDCFNGQASFDNPAYFFVYDAAGNSYGYMTVSLASYSNITSNANAPCFVPPSNICVEEGIYIGYTYLAPKPGGYNIAYQRCCRNGTIVNLANPGAEGATYLIHIPDPALAATNSSPRFNNYPLNFICASLPVNFDHSATDPDGDSLVYKLCAPYTGASQNCPMPYPFAWGCPTSAPPPPYTTVTYATGYSATYPMSSWPMLNINSQTGWLSGFPNMIGQWVVGVSVEEYRNGHLLSTNIRDFQFNVVNCPGQPYYVPPMPQCVTGNSYNFTAGNSYLPGTSFQWTFGPNAMPSSSSQQNPTGIVFAAPGTYAVTLTVVQNNCSQSYTDSVVVYPQLQARFGAIPVRGCVPLAVQFTDSSVAGVPLSYYWDFGDGDTSSMQDPFHIYSSPGTYSVKLTITASSGCAGQTSTTINNMITVYPLPFAGFTVSPPSASIFDPVIGIVDQSVNGVSCSVTFGDGGCDSSFNCQHSYAAPGKYTVMQVVTDTNGCKDTAYAIAEILPEHRFYVPNSFTPNDDGHNDVFLPSMTGVTEYRFMIFDRWGKLVMSTDDPSCGWDGRYRGAACQEGVYVYHIYFRDEVEHRQHTYTGHVSLIR